MDLSSVMRQLEKMGTAQNAKVYKRHGAGDNLFGVSFANLRTLQRTIQCNHALARELWKSGNTDARTLATLIADPVQMTHAEAEAWLRDVRYYVLADMLAALIARAPFATQAMKKWMQSKDEFVRQGGYAVLACALRDGRDGISDADCRAILKTIEKEIHGSPNRARHAMNSALIAIGIYRPSLTREAIAAARRIGKVEVDHGETSCVTPDAVSYIQKALRRKKR